MTIKKSDGDKIFQYIEKNRDAPNGPNPEAYSIEVVFTLDEENAPLSAEVIHSFIFIPLRTTRITQSS